MLSLILGCGYSGRHIAARLMQHGEVVGTRRTEEGVAELATDTIRGVVADGEVSPELREVLEGTTHLISSVAPERSLPLLDPMLDVIKPVVEAGGMPSLTWIGYLSTIGVYGDHAGCWVDEETPCISGQPRSIARVQAEQAWQALGDAAKVPVTTLRLSGIYGPGRNAVRDALVGRARMLIKPDQVFNRIHVEDLARAASLSATSAQDGVVNVTDDEPAAPQEVIRYAHDLVGKPPPVAVPFAEADISPMARSFYAENKRVSNARSKVLLGLQYRYPDYRCGLASLVENERATTIE